MCKFFSFIQNKDGDIAYLGAKERRRGCASDVADHHSCIASYFHWNIDDCNKFEVDILTGEIDNDEIVHEDHVSRAHAWAKTLDYRLVHDTIKVKTPWLVVKKLREKWGKPIKFKNRLADTDKTALKIAGNWVRRHFYARVLAPATGQGTNRRLPSYVGSLAGGSGFRELVVINAIYKRRLYKADRAIVHLAKKGIYYHDDNFVVYGGVCNFDYYDVSDLLVRFS